jgi:hypothetical protein
MTGFLGVTLHRNMERSGAYSALIPAWLHLAMHAGVARL